MGLPTSPNITIPSVPADILTRPFEPPKRLHMKHYGAVGDGWMAYDAQVSASSKIVTSSTGFAGDSAVTGYPKRNNAIAVGKTVWIRGAGTGGRSFTTTVAAVNSNNSIELTDQPPTSVSGAYMIWGTNNYSAIRAITTDAIDYGLAIEADPFIYLSIGDFATHDRFSEPVNAMFPIQPVSEFGPTGRRLGRRQLTIYSNQVHHPQQCWLTEDVPPALHIGCWIVTSGEFEEPGGGMPVPHVFGGSAQAWQVQVNLINVAIALDPNPTGIGVAYGGIRGKELSSTNYLGVVVAGNTSIAQAIEPTASYWQGIFGLSVAGAMREQNNVNLNSQAWLCPVGGTATEHLWLAGSNFYAGCKIGLMAPPSTQLWTADKINFHWNAIHFKVDCPTGETRFVINAMNFEEKTAAEYNGKPWLQTTAHISDPDSKGSGIIRCAHISYSTTHGVPDGIAVVGALNTNIYNYKGELLHPA